MDASVKITVVSNNMKVITNYLPASGEGKHLTIENVLSQLASMGITTGIKNDIIEQMCASERPVPSVVIAEGISSEIGEKAKIEMYIKINIRTKATERENGSVDFHDLGDICSTTEGSPLYRKIPPTVGKPGKDVYGKEIPGIMGKDLKLVVGQGTKIDEVDPNLVRAATDGEVLLNKGIIQVSPFHIVTSDVDFSTGNVRFKGSIVINGTVKAGFEVIAEGNIEIKGNVEDALVDGGRDIIIQGGFTGSGSGMIRSKQDVFLKFVENQRVEADRDIVINGDAYHATLLAGRSIQVKVNKGTIVGGHCEAKVSVTANTFGSVACPPTKIVVGLDPKFAEKLKKIESEIEMRKLSLEKIEKSVIFLYKLKIGGKGYLPSEKLLLLEKLESAKKKLPEEIESFIQVKETLLQEQKDVENAFAIAERAVYPKVQIYIGNQWVSNEDTFGPSRYQLVAGEVARLSK